jgi:tetratricopeptide (TPR) repeat protein/ABC-type multidrug transport system permease subunit
VISNSVVLKAIGTILLIFLPTHASPQSPTWARCANEEKTFTLDASIKGCDAVIQSGKESQPDLAIAYYNRGQSYQSKKEYNRAIADFTKAIELDPRDPDYFLGRALAHQSAQDHDRAIADFTMAIVRDANNPDLFAGRAASYRAKKEHDPAIADYSTAVQLSPDEATYYNARGHIFRAKQEYDLAISDYSKAIGISPKYVSAYYNRAHAHRGKRHFDLAIADYSKTIDLNPKLAGAYSYRGYAFAGKGQYDQAIKDLTTAIELSPNFDEAYGYRGMAHREKGEYARSISDFTKAIELDPNDATHYQGRAITFVRNANYSAAIRDYDKALEMDPNNHRYYRERGWVQFKMKKYAEALSDANRALQLNPDDSNSLEVRGQVLESLGRTNDAITDFRQAVRIDPTLSDSIAALKRLESTLVPPLPRIALRPQPDDKGAINDKQNKSALANIDTTASRKEDEKSNAARRALCRQVDRILQETPQGCSGGKNGDSDAVEIVGLAADPGTNARTVVPRAVGLITLFIAFSFSCRSMIRDISSNTLPVLLAIARNNWLTLIAAKLIASVAVAIVIFAALIIFSGWHQSFNIKPGLSMILVLVVLGSATSAVYGTLVGFIGRTETRINVLASLYIMALVLLSDFITEFDRSNHLLVALSGVLPLKFLIDPLSNWMLFGAELSLAYEGFHKMVAQLIVASTILWYLVRRRAHLD